MGNVKLPNVDGMTTIEELRNGVGKMTKELSWLLTNLDTRNVNELDAEVIIARSIIAGKLAADSVETDNLVAGAITTEKIEVGAVTAEKITVDELSAITANLGHITAGLIESIRIFGSYVATRNGAFPRAELNNEGDLLAVYTDANNYMTIEPGLFNEPTQVFRKGGSPSLAVGPIGIMTGVISPDLDLIIGSDNGSLSLICGSGIFDNINAPSWSKLRSEETGISIQDELDSIRAELAGKADISHSHSVTIPPGSAGGTFPVS